MRGRATRVFAHLLEVLEAPVGEHERVELQRRDHRAFDVQLVGGGRARGAHTGHAAADRRELHSRAGRGVRDVGRPGGRQCARSAARSAFGRRRNAQHLQTRGSIRAGSVWRSTVLYAVCTYQPAITRRKA